MEASGLQSGKLAILPTSAMDSVIPPGPVTEPASVDEGIVAEARIAGISISNEDLAAKIAAHCDDMAQLSSDDPTVQGCLKLFYDTQRVDVPVILSGCGDFGALEKTLSGLVHVIDTRNAPALVTRLSLHLALMKELFAWLGQLKHIDRDGLMAELTASYARAREEVRLCLEHSIADETARIGEVSQESERLTNDLQVNQEAYMTVSNSVQSLQGAISELRERLVTLESDLSDLQ